MKTLDERPVTLTEVKAILQAYEKEAKKDDREMLYEQAKSKDYADKFAVLSIKDVKELRDKLAGLGLELSEERIVKIIDLLPEDVDDVRAIFAKERFKYTEEEINQVVDLVKQYK